MEERIGHYRIVSELGRGGMGVVYKAHEESLNRFVALKVLGDHLAEDSEYVERFQREARSAAALTHPNIVQVYRVDEDGGKHYFAMEYVSGTSIQRMIKTQGKLEATAAVRLMLQAASGLGAAHEHGVIHRDIKPANLMVDDRGLVKIADFGLALLAGGATRLTATGMFMGTPGYLSPEQCLDEGPDHRTDIYSLGVTFYEMLTGLIPFTADSPLALLRRIIEVEPKDVRELNPEVPEAVRAILNKMMAKKREDRYADCAELIIDLQAFLATADDEKSGVSSVVAAAAAATAAAGEKTVIVAPDGDPTLVEPESGEPTVIAPTENGDFNTSPTMRVDSSELPAGNLSPPPPPPPASPRGTEVEPEMVADPVLSTQETSSPSGARTGLAIAAVIIVVLLSGGLLAAWKLGAFGLMRTLVASRSVDETPDIPVMLIAQTEISEAAADEVADPARDEADTGASAGVAVGETSSPGANSPISEETISESHASTESGSAAVTDPDQGTSSRNTIAVPNTGRSTAIAAPYQDPAEEGIPSQPQNPVVAPPRVGRGVALITVGEPLVANAAADFVRQALERRGLEVFDGSGLPGVLDTLESGATEDAGTLVELVRPHARVVVVVRADFMGERQLRYQGRYDTEFQARLHIVGHDLKSLRPLGRGIHVPIGYTHLNVDRKVEEALRTNMRGMAGSIGDIGNR